jgi:glycosyltransferase involved in cell wall biosynthesis
MSDGKRLNNNSAMVGSTMATQLSAHASPLIDWPPQRVPSPDQPRLFINGRFLVQQVTGVQRVAREITTEIDRMLENGELRADVTLLVPPGPWVQRLSLNRIRVETIGRFRGLLWEQLALAGQVKGGTLLCLGNSAPARALLDRKTRVAVMIHDVSFLDYPGAYKFLYRLGHRLMLPLLMRRARAILTVSETERERLERLVPESAPRITVAPNGGWSADEAAPGAAAGAEPALPPPGYGLYVGSLSHRKNFGRTLAAAIRLAREDGLHFVFVGAAGKVLREPRREVPADVADRIHFVGQVNDPARLSRIYRDARVLLFPSLYEACPLPPVEAPHFGCPAVVSNIPAMWERCGRGATYCDPTSVESILRAMREVLGDSPKRDQAIAAGHDMARQRRWSEQAATLCTAVLR